MAFKIYNTLTRGLEEFEPLNPPHVRMYTCGPTVYDYAHIGNFRAYIFEDLLRRYLRYQGYQLTQVMNLTDVDDKTIRGARAAGMPLDAWTVPYKAAFFEDLKTLRIEPAEHYPAATAHIPEMIALIEVLLRNGVAYRSDDGSVYFSIAAFPAYGRLARLDMAGLKPGARIAQDEYHKENAADFVLWKAWQSEDGEVAWDSPWGRGRPGWHIECSAMSMKYLGPSLDLHTGGIDNIFPHHEDEIAQSEAATGRPFVKYWMHCAHLVVDGRKMSKSLGNFHTLRELLQRGFSGREIRYALLSAHYRQTLNFTQDALLAARGALGRLDEFDGRLRDVAGAELAASDDAAKPKPLPDWMAQAKTSFLSALDDDLNISLALGALFDLVHEGNRRINAALLAPEDALVLLELLLDFDRVLGVWRQIECGEIPSVILQKAEERQAARVSRDWPRADVLRGEVEALGWLIQDVAGGYKLKRKGAS